MATHSSILSWRIPWTEEPGGLLSEGHKESDMTEGLTNTQIHPIPIYICLSSQIFPLEEAYKPQAYIDQEIIILLVSVISVAG